MLAGRLALLSNKLKDAQRLLSQALRLTPGDKMAEGLLGETFYRQDKMADAAIHFRAAGKGSVADKLASFGNDAVYKIIGSADSTSLKFVKTDPLPVVSATIGGKNYNFLIDTGGGELIIDTEVAKALSLRQFGEESGTFGGGRKASVIQGRLDEITLGAFTVRNLPIAILPTQRFAAQLGIDHIDGILGTVLLSRFIPTLDYQSGELVLRKKDAGSLAKIKYDVEIPIRISGDHLIVAWGRVNNSPQLLFVDTGLAGMGFAPTDSTIKDAGILVNGKPFESGGGGGAVRATPFQVDEIALGNESRKGIIGVAGVFPSALEMGQGFRIGGLVSHTFFRPYKLTIDLLKMRLLLKR